MAIPKLNTEKLDFLKTNRFMGIDADFNENGTTFHYVVLKKNGEQLSIEKSGSVFSLDELPKKYPTILSISGRGVLFKNADGRIEDVQQSVHEFFPGINAHDFYANAHYQFIAVARKQMVDGVLEELKSKKIIVTDVFLGPFLVANIIELMNQSGDEFQFGGYHALVVNQTLQSIQAITQKSLENFVVGGEVIGGDHLVAFANAFNGFFQINNGIEAELIEQSKDEWKHKQIFSFGWKFALSFIALALILNYVLAQYYNEKRVDLDFEASISQDKIAKVNLLKSQIAQKSLMIQSMGALNAGSISYFADQIALTRPSSIQLTDLSIFPLENTIQEEKPISFNKDLITMKGITKRSSFLNQWINELKAKEWVGDVSIIDYQIGKNGANFELEITLR